MLRAAWCAAGAAFGIEAGASCPSQAHRRGDAVRKAELSAVIVLRKSSIITVKKSCSPRSNYTRHALAQAFPKPKPCAPLLAQASVHDGSASPSHHGFGWCDTSCS